MSAKLHRITRSKGSFCLALEPMGVLKLILEIWYLILPVAVFIGGLIYRKITHQPFKGEIPPVGVLRDLPSSVTGLNKQEEKMDENTQSKRC